jgi:hypothetical protein
MLRTQGVPVRSPFPSSQAVPCSSSPNSPPVRRSR